MWERNEKALINGPVPLTAVNYYIFIYSSRCTIDCYAACLTSQRKTARFAYCQHIYILKFGVTTEHRHFSAPITGAPSPLYTLKPFANIKLSMSGIKQKFLPDRISLGGPSLSTIQYKTVLIIRTASHTI